MAIGGMDVWRHEVEVLDRSAFYAGDLGEDLGFALAHRLTRRLGFPIAMGAIEKFLIRSQLEGLAAGGADLLPQVAGFLDHPLLDFHRPCLLSRQGLGRGREGRVKGFRAHGFLEKTGRSG
jgi:hypothetical protein